MPKMMEPHAQPVRVMRAAQVVKAVKQATKNKKPAQAVHIMLVDTHVLMLTALHRVVATFPQVKIVAHTHTVHDVSTRLERKDVDVVVFGVSISVSECLQFINSVGGNHASLGVVVIQPCLRPETAVALIKQGVHGLLDEFASEQDLADAISIVATGSTFFSKHAREMLTSSMSRAAIYLTARELEVASLLMRGESNFRIAQALSLKEKTIEAHLTSIYSKLCVNSRSEAILCLQGLHI
jgi:DNA-binding NarL/FixJ family response regulator